ncbi:protein PBDC1 [Hetaerina americana]|uniref:protein PBDC1 n=1 Tax=Hetaerina americana TaxID=62018 RepID=UPI003A7F35A2
MDSVGPEGLLAGASLLSRPADEFGNDPTVEAMWAINAMGHAEVYFNILCSVDPKFLKLTPHDDRIYSLFREEFPDFKVENIKEDDLKSEDAKKKWRPFCEEFKGVVEDYNFATLLRLNCGEDYSEENSILVTRIQFYAIELARNKEGLNDALRCRNQAKKES